MTYKGYFPIFNKNINERFQEFHNISSNNFNLENKAEPNSFSINDQGDACGGASAAGCRARNSV